MIAPPAPLTLPDSAATDRVGIALGHALRAGDTVLLHGALGAGKSALARAAIKARCGVDTEVPSPTYTLVQVYEAADLTIWHTDLYRLGDPGEVPELGLQEAFTEAAVLVEWPDRLGPWKPVRSLMLGLEPTDGDGRLLSMTASGEGWQRAMAAMAEAV